MEPKDIQVIVFHSPCQDGLAAASVAFKYAEENDVKYEFIPLTNNSDYVFPEEYRTKKIAFFDIAPTDEHLKQLEGTTIAVFDHHKTNEQRLKGRKDTVFDMNKSGVGLAWSYFYPEDPMPLPLQMIQDRDLWTWKILGSKEFCSGLFTHLSANDTLEDSLDFINSVVDSSLCNIYGGSRYDDPLFRNICSFGSVLEKVRAKTISNMAVAAAKKIYHYKGYKVCIVNCDHEYASDLGHAILKDNKEIDFVVCWRYNHEKEEYWLSLRADNKVDVAAICEEYGGGGHKNAAGCSVKVHPSILFSCD